MRAQSLDPKEPQSDEPWRKLPLYETVLVKSVHDGQLVKFKSGQNIEAGVRGYKDVVTDKDAQAEPAVAD